MKNTTAPVEKDVTGGPEILAQDNVTHVEEPPDEEKSHNDLPDAAFAFIESGGEKDEGGKTTPRNLRHLPHHTSAVTDGGDNSTVDKALYRNALARVNQVKPVTDTISQEELQKKASAHLERHRAVLEDGKSLTLDKEQSVDEQIQVTPAPETAPEQSVAKESGGDKIEEMLTRILSKLDEVLATSNKVAGASVPAIETKTEPEPEIKKEEPATEVETKTTEVAKAESESNLVKAMTDTLAKSLEDFLAKAKENDEAVKKEILDYIEKLRNTPQPTKAQMVPAEEPEESKPPKVKTIDELRAEMRDRIQKGMNLNR